MPELPEVEATAQYLRERIIGGLISDVRVLWHRTVAHPSVDRFRRHLKGRVITQVGRRGKFVVITLEGESPLFLFIHLRMSGSLDVLSTKHDLHTHDRLEIQLTSGKSIRFHDTRKFGKAYLYSSPNAVESKLGIEPLEAQFTVEALKEILSPRKSKIKSLLLDQAHIAGLGNIYVDEALWCARIHPTALACSISHVKVAKLHSCIQAILTEAINHLGTDFGDNVVHGGQYQPKVYGRDGAPCLRCSSTITRTVVGQRGTHFCPRCQRV